jgi:hypothetical protein
MDLLSFTRRSFTCRGSPLDASIELGRKQMNVFTRTVAPGKVSRGPHTTTQHPQYEQFSLMCSLWKIGVCLPGHALTWMGGAPPQLFLNYAQLIVPLGVADQVLTTSLYTNDAISALQINRRCAAVPPRPFIWDLAHGRFPWMLQVLSALPPHIVWHCIHIGVHHCCFEYQIPEMWPSSSKYSESNSQVV